MKLYKKCTATLYFFLFNDTTSYTTPTPDTTHTNSLLFRWNLLQRIWKVMMTVDDKIRDEILQYNISRVTEKIALSSDEIEKFEYLTGKEILPPDQSKIIKLNLLKLNLLNHYLESYLKNKQKQLQVKEMNNLKSKKALKSSIIKKRLHLIGH